MRMTMPVMFLLVLSGCAGYRPAPCPPPSVWVREVEPPPERYQIKYQYRGAKVVPDFAGIERNGEFVVTPVVPGELRYGPGAPVGSLDNRGGHGKLVNR
jgi:hypothetical protein